MSDQEVALTLSKPATVASPGPVPSLPPCPVFPLPESVGDKDVGDGRKDADPVKTGLPWRLAKAWHIQRGRRERLSPATAAERTRRHVALAQVASGNFPEPQWTALEGGGLRIVQGTLSVYSRHLINAGSPSARVPLPRGQRQREGDIVPRASVPLPRATAGALGTGTSASGADLDGSGCR